MIYKTESFRECRRFCCTLEKYFSAEIWNITFVIFWPIWCQDSLVKSKHKVWARTVYFITGKNFWDFVWLERINIVEYIRVFSGYKIWVIMLGVGFFVSLLIKCNMLQQKGPFTENIGEINPKTENSLN